jgi:hypothetical protein
VTGKDFGDWKSKFYAYTVRVTDIGPTFKFKVPVGWQIYAWQEKARGRTFFPLKPSVGLSEKKGRPLAFPCLALICQPTGTYIPLTLQLC